MNENFIKDIHGIIEHGRNLAYKTVSSAMTLTYWQLGRRIVEEEQNGSERANYGEQLMQILAKDLTEKFGKGFTERALRQYRQFYLVFPDFIKWYARVLFLTWTHFRSLMQVDSVTVENQNVFR